MYFVCMCPHSLLCVRCPHYLAISTVHDRYQWERKGWDEKAQGIRCGHAHPPFIPSSTTIPYLSRPNLLSIGAAGCPELETSAAAPTGGARWRRANEQMVEMIDQWASVLPACLPACLLAERSSWALDSWTVGRKGVMARQIGKQASQLPAAQSGMCGMA
ncbi:hypothetical protein BKA80DRAFT_269039 [Phyllosticta citrichinensis]